MNQIRLMGGLGNQLFQYAFGRAMSGEVIFDDSWFRKVSNKERPLLLNKFNIQKLNVFGKKIAGLNYAREIDHIYNENYQLLDGLYLDGYWQHLAYFQNIIPDLQKEITLNSDLTPEFLTMLEKIESDPFAISMHIRRGDYLNQTGWGVLPNRYYYLALKQARGNLYIFSDDLEYCKPLYDESYFACRKVTFVEGFQPHQDFELMKACKYHIIANSTFSYWAALMDSKPDKVVWCPEYWLGESEPDLNGTHYPKEWIKIKENLI